MTNSTNTPGPIPKPGAKPIPLLITLTIFFAIWFSPHPKGMDPKAWQLFAIFVSTIVGIIIKPLPMGAVAFIGLSTTIVTGLLEFKQAFSGFNNPVVWLVALAFFIARGFIKTGLGTRISYHCIKILGNHTLGLSYGVLLTDLILAPSIPSVTARSGGIIFPIIKALSQSFGSYTKDGTERKIGSFLLLTTFHGTCITSAMFLTAMSGNPLIMELAAAQGVSITWTNWALAASLPGLVSLALIPLVIYLLYPPEIKHTPEAKAFAIQNLKKLGPVKFQEWIMLTTFFMLLVLWIIGANIGFSATTTAIIGLIVLLLTGTLEWNDILKEKSAWETLVWFATLVMMASFLNTFGFITWFGQNITALLPHNNWISAFTGLCIIYYFSHYLFAGNITHISAMYSTFLLLAIGTGAPPLLAALALGFFSNLFGGLTHYACGPALIYFGSRYIDIVTWWRFGLLIGCMHLLIWLSLGSLWWKILGLW